MGSYSFATSWIQELSIFLCKSLSEYFNGDNEWENGESSCNLPHYGIIVPSVSTFQYLVWFLTHGVWLNILMGTLSSSKMVMTECLTVPCFVAIMKGINKRYRNFKKSAIMCYTHFYLVIESSWVVKLGSEESSNTFSTTVAKPEHKIRRNNFYQC